MNQIVAYYSQNGHPQYPEDTWRHSEPVKNAEDLFQFMRYCHLRDARNRNNYPLTTHWNSLDIKFYSRKVEVCNLGHKHYGKETWIDNPEFYNDGLKLYLEWVGRLNRTIPYLRKAHKKKKQEQQEKENLKRLKEKYEN